MTEAMKIPAARAAIEKEMKKLSDQRVWSVETVRENDDIKREAKETGRKVHFATISPRCFRKHSALDENTTSTKVGQFCVEII